MTIIVQSYVQTLIIFKSFKVSTCFGQSNEETAAIARVGPSDARALVLCSFLLCSSLRVPFLNVVTFKINKCLHIRLQNNRHKWKSAT
jgi:hypothetical protein